MIELTLIHGWGVNGHIFGDFCFRLPETWVVNAPHLAGHGGAPLYGTFSIEQAADDLAATWDAPRFVLGWSLGSQIALHLAHRHPEKVRGLILMSGFAKLRATDDYPQGVSNALLAKMLGLFQQNYAQYVQQFLQLQVLNTPEKKPLIEQILPDLVKNGAPQALQAALNALEAADARTLLPEIRQPSLVICGNKDGVTPLRMSEYLAQHLSNARLYVIDKAAHAPFFSHDEQCVALLCTFVQEVLESRFQAA